MEVVSHLAPEVPDMQKAGRKGKYRMRSPRYRLQ